MNDDEFLLQDPPPTPKPKSNRSWLLVAFDTGGEGHVLDHRGWAFGVLADDVYGTPIVGMRTEGIDIEDPVGAYGVWVWVGRITFSGGGYNSYSGDYDDIEAHFKGRWRRPTEIELAKLQS